MKPTLADLYERTEKTETCWIWKGARNHKGYGTLSRRIDGHVKTILIHRLSYELHKGPIPEGLQIRHVCANPPCLRPDHLLVGTALENWHDVPAEKRSQIRRDIWAKIPPEQRSQMLKDRLAKMSPETQLNRAEKIAASKLDKKLSPEHIAKLRAAKLGKPAKISEEAKARRAEKLKAIWSDPTKRATQTPTEQQREANSAKHRELWASGAYANRKPKGTP